ncbi:hypothetical protein ONS95_001552 [Cadophora gregata]|uniref:uncharacterized protein n=1 Tax=Cadophora gregata TaxID=51156 RepID=UPI0026DCC31A|nr:uncharacterized protein ONS95_001552 [Cadophora gregata]KAK0111176.1 hypothetical protein ONS95_001552 [Cadophora gregata]KAK0112355.1 hypothetical protein ONS96_001600 [Cadophora gregata f. sp. sojae]
MASDGMPVVLFGKLPVVTTPMTEALKPEVDVIHLIESVTTARSELPLILSSSSKPNKITPTSQTGSNTLRPDSEQRRPVAVIVGGGFTPEEFEELRGLEGGETVTWLRADNSLVPESEWPPNPVYPGRAAGRVKEVLRREGILGGERDEGEVKGKGGVFFY